MANFKPVRITQSQLSTWSDSQGQLIFAYDTGRVFLVTPYGRVQQGVTTISDSSQFPAVPANKLYFVKNTGKLFAYTSDRGWIDLAKNTGYKDVLNGYSAKVKKITNTTVSMVSDSVQTDMSKFAVGDTVYFDIVQSQSGDTWWAHRTIQSISGFNVTIDRGFTNRDYDSQYASDGAYVMQVANPQRLVGLDDGISFGAKNFVTGQRSQAFGSYNVATGIASAVFGVDNKVIGQLAFVAGNTNRVIGAQSKVIGIGNRVTQDLCRVIGNGNSALAQGTLTIGDGNQTTGLGTSISIGLNNSNKGFSGILIGNNNFTHGHMQICVGRSLVNRAREATMLGTRGQLSDSPDNRAAVAFAGGHGTGKLISFIHRVNRSQLNPAYNAGTDPNNTGKDGDGEPKYVDIQGFRTTYRGCMKPMTQTLDISESQTVTLDPTMWGRIVLTGTGTIDLQAASHFQDGDSVQVVVNTSNITVNLDAQWIGQVDVLTQQPGLHVLQITNHVGTIFFRSLYAQYKLKWENPV